LREAIQLKRNYFILKLFNLFFNPAFGV